MRGYLPDYEVDAPGTLGGVLSRLAEGNDWRPLAGGTDVMVVLAAGSLPAGRYVSIWELDELRGVQVTDQSVTVGALTTYTDVRTHEIFGREFPMLVEAARLSGAAAIQNRGTLGGNVVNASPAADSPPALLAYDAEIKLASTRGERWVPYRGFHSGYKQMDRAPDELLTAIRLPRQPGGPRALHYYRKVGTRKAQAISKVGIAALGRVDDGVVRHLRLGFASVAPVPFVATGTESLLQGSALDDARIDAAVQSLSNELVPIDDVRSTSTYRHRVACNLLRDFLRQLAAAG